MRILLAALAAATAAAAPAVVARIPVAKLAAPCAAAAGGRYVWVSEYGAPYLLKIDPRTNKIVAKTQIGTGSCGLGYGAGSLWVEDTSSSTVSRVSASTGKRLKAIPVGIAPYDATFAYGAAWTTAYGQGELERIDAKRNRVAGRWKLPLATGVVGAFGSVWAAGSKLWRQTQAVSLASRWIEIEGTSEMVVTLWMSPSGGSSAKNSPVSTVCSWVTSRSATPSRLPSSVRR